MKWVKIAGVIIGAVSITALGIDAADTLQGSRSTLLGQVISQNSSTCPRGMIEVPMAESFSCVDLYESSADKKCPSSDPKNEQDTRNNLDDTNCGAISEENTMPWRFVTRDQAQVACLRSGKRLPTAKEWFIFSAGTPDAIGICNIDSSGVKTVGSEGKCTSAVGAYDTVGNVWEWTTDDVIQGKYNGRDVPESGYVAQVDSNGVAVLTNQEESELFSSDYFWSSSEGAYGMMRGGFYGSKNDAGSYSVHAQTLPTTAGTAIGFRCIQ